MSIASRPFRARALVLAALLVLGGGLAATAADQFSGKVVGIADGDTIQVLREQRSVRVRLNGVDAPEKGQAFGDRARQFVASLAFGQVVTVVVHGEDQYGRTIGDVILADGRNLNREIVRAGFAWWFRRYSTDESLGALEAEARAAKRGLWADLHPVPPWEYRQAQAPRRTDGPGSVQPAPSVQPATGPIIGNKRSRIYHRPDCPNYADVAPQNRVPFASAAEAEQAGYRVARNCP